MEDLFFLEPPKDLVHPRKRKHLAPEQPHDIPLNPPEAKGATESYFCDPGRKIFPGLTLGKGTPI